MNRITQEMKFRQSLVKYAQATTVIKAARKYNKSRSYIYFWLDRYDDKARFFSFSDFDTQLRKHNQRSNKMPSHLWASCLLLNFLLNMSNMFDKPTGEKSR